MSLAGLLGFYMLTIVFWALRDSLDYLSWTKVDNKKYSIWKHIVAIVSYGSMFLFGFWCAYQIFVLNHTSNIIWVLICYALFRFYFFDMFRIKFTGSKIEGSTDPLDIFWKWMDINVNTGAFWLIKLFLAFITACAMGEYLC